MIYLWPNKPLDLGGLTHRPGERPLAGPQGCSFDLRSGRAPDLPGHHREAGSVLLRAGLQRPVFFKHRVAVAGQRPAVHVCSDSCVEQIYARKCASRESSGHLKGNSHQLVFVLYLLHLRGRTGLPPLTLRLPRGQRARRGRPHALCTHCLRAGWAQGGLGAGQAGHRGRLGAGAGWVQGQAGYGLQPSLTGFLLKQSSSPLRSSPNTATLTFLGCLPT